MEKLKTLCLKNGIELDSCKLELFERYKELLKKWGRRVNLTSILEDEEIEVKHFFDSLLGLKAFEALGFPVENRSFCDVGSGGGFPGVPLAVVLDSSEFVLVESRHKRCVFLEQVKRELKLVNVSVSCQRIEEHEGRYDYLLMRAVKEPKRAVKMTEKFLEKGAVLCIYRGKERFEGKLEGYSVKEVEVVPEGGDFLRHFLFIRKDGGN